MSAPEARFKILVTSVRELTYSSRVFWKIVTDPGLPEEGAITADKGASFDVPDSAALPFEFVKGGRYDVSISPEPLF